MAAANTDKFRKKRSNFSTTLNGGISSVDTTVALNSASGLPTDTAITLTVDRVDANGDSTPSLKERITGVVSSNNLTNCLRGEDSSTAQSHISGSVVEDIWDADTWNDALTALLVEHSQAGVHDATILMKLAGTQTITGAKTFGSALLIATRPKITTSLDDTNGNEVFKITPTASAVNEATLINGATGSNFGMTMSGGDTDVGFDLRMKGAGKFRKPTVVGIMVTDVATNEATGDGKAFFRVPAELNGMNLTGVNASNAVAGTTGTNDTQLRRKRSGSDVDMLSTKITIDSTELDTSTAATPAVINASNDDVATGDLIFIDKDAIQTTPAKGFYVELRFELP